MASAGQSLSSTHLTRANHSGCEPAANVLLSTVQPVPSLREAPSALPRWLQGGQPILEACGFSLNQTRIVEALGEERDALERGHKLQCESVRVSPSEHTELRGQPSHRFGKKSVRPFAQEASLLEQFRA